MNRRQSAVLDMLRRVQGFLDRNSDTLAAVQASGARKTLDAFVDRITPPPTSATPRLGPSPSSA